MKTATTQINIDDLNESLKNKTSVEIIEWAISIAKKPVVTTNFRPYEGAILYACTQVMKDMTVVWCDTGYNTVNTYKHAEELKSLLSLNIDLFVPEQTAAHRDVVLGIPDVDDPKHKIFTEQVKLEPFKRAMEFHKPDVWFTNLRKGQTAFRDNIGIVSLSKDGILKVSPFYHWSDSDLDAYLDAHGVPNEFKYYDPTKVLENRECGLHS